MKLLKVDTIEEARAKLLEAASGKVPEVKEMAFHEACGRICAEDIKSAVNIPDFRKSTVDGYAVVAADTQGAGESIPVFLEVAEHIDIGMKPKRTVKPGQCAYVPTGGMLPEGADAMVMVEYCEKFDENSIAVYDAVSPGRNIIAIGEDVKVNDTIMAKGTTLRPQEIGVMASVGITDVNVYKPWKVFVISTGDELVDADENPRLGQTRDINTYSICAAAEQYGFRVIGTAVVKDERKVLHDIIERVMAKCDLVVISGGSSKGDRDYTADVLDELSEGGVFTHGIALKPGKPTILGFDNSSQTILMGLPGHPVAATLVFELMAIWLHRKLTGQSEPAATTARLTENVAAGAGRATCLLVELVETETSGRLSYDAVPIHGKSGLMTTMTRAHGYVMIGTNEEGLKKGEYVKVHLFSLYK